MQAILTQSSTKEKKIMRKILTTWGMILLMLVSIVGTVAAQSGVDPSATPTSVPTSQPAAPTVYVHPIVQILSGYFGRVTRPMLPTATLPPTMTATVAGTVDPAATATAVPTGAPTATPTATPTTPMTPEEFAAQIAKYHADGMGFGVLVKLYDMAEAAVKACADQPAPAAGEVIDPTVPACEAVTVEELVSQFQSGGGMGQLFKEYGKPALLGVGQVKKAMKNLPAATQVTPTPAATLAATSAPAATMGSIDQQTQNQKSNNGKGNTNTNSNKPVKTKTPKSNSHGR
jgi:hypothetical protein